MSAKADILARTRAALPDRGQDAQSILSAPVLRGAGDVDLFAERAADYAATVTRTYDPDRTVAERLAHHGADRVAHEGDVLSVAELDALDGVVTGCACAIAETGTILLVGDRALTLVPDLHVCVVRADQVLADVPDALAHVRADVDAGRAITLVSGPSATSDIELERVEGVHGPRRLEIVLVSAPSPSGTG